MGNQLLNWRPWLWPDNEDEAVLSELEKRAATVIADYDGREGLTDAQRRLLGKAWRDQMYVDRERVRRGQDR